MSFFSYKKDMFSENDLNYFKIELVDGKRVNVVGNFKLNNVSEDEIDFSTKNKRLKISGKNFIISSISKGEIFIDGEVMKIELEKKNGK